MKKPLCVLLLALLFQSCSTSLKNQTNLNTVSFDKQGHRGARGLLPENTIAGMLKAIELGVTTLEMDVVISKDHLVVVSHDPYFHESITTTPSGSYLSKNETSDHLLYAMPYDSIKKYDVGLKPHPAFQKQEKIPAFKPLLTDLFDATEKFSIKRNSAIKYNVEIKSQPSGDGKQHPEIETFVDLVMQVILKKNIAERCNIQSFDIRALQTMHRKYPSVSTGLLIENNDKRSIEQQLDQLGFTPNIYSPHFSLVDQAKVDYCHKNKMKLICWTVNTLSEMKRQVSFRVDGIITDYPNLFAELFPH